ncbi:MAG: peptidase and domain protein [Proteobacteria bacterium]|nr:peptidase and domain protein [Pseudomonadota bacterium]
MKQILHGLFAAALTPSRLLLPVVGNKVPAGFPSPAEDWAEERTDLNQRYVPHPETTYFIQVCGDSMTSPIAERSIPNNAMLIVDRGREAKHNDIVVALLDDEYTVKRLYQRGNRLALLAENPSYQPMVLNEGQELGIWGVVTAWIMEPQ